MHKITMDSNYDHLATETWCRDFWQQEEIFRYNHTSTAPVFSVDTPPPYVSASHLHVGHAMSYSQAEFIVRYKRMRGFNIYYPMGFDDNGLPTERYVEKKYNIDKSKTSRSEFRALCIQETETTALVYEQLWRAMGLSIDWHQRYSTIGEQARRTSQKSFLDLYRKGLIYRSAEPVIWDTHFDTSLAQADLEWLSRKGVLYDIRFSSPQGQPLVISTTRPELIPSCVAMFHHPKDARYTALQGQHAVVPLFGHQVPILSSMEVDQDFGTGLMMVCTFGDAEDVRKWKEHNLETRISINRRGRMTDLAGPFAGMTTPQARKEIIKALKLENLVLGEKTVDQNVAVGERSGEPVEYVMEPQWFIRLMEHREAFLKRADELEWYPEFMKTRLKDWINGLKYDWNISRQRFYGVPVPVWFVQETGDVVLPDEADLPVDPMEDAPPAWAQSKYPGMTLVADSDVLDTWMTSSMTPQINSNWAEMEGGIGEANLFPMGVRVQAFEIIRTWLFYSVAKAHFHNQSLPWKTVMISGWGLNEQGKKISKRDLDRLTDADGFNRYEPYNLIQRYGADSVRFWAAGSHLGQDLRYHEKDIRTGRKVVVKLWNVARFCCLQLDNFDPTAERIPVARRNVEDRWMLARLHATIGGMTEHLDRYDYANARTLVEEFFWRVFCDNYVEIIKDRFWDQDRTSSHEERSSQASLYEALRMLLGLFAPFVPFVTEKLFQEIYKPQEGGLSLHVTPWPEQDEAIKALGLEADGVMDRLLSLLQAARFLRSQKKLPQNLRLPRLMVTLTAEGEVEREFLQTHRGLILMALRTDDLALDVGPGDVLVENALPGVTLSLASESIPAPSVEE